MSKYITKIEEITEECYIILYPESHPIPGSKIYSVQSLHTISWKIEMFKNKEEWVREIENRTYMRNTWLVSYYQQLLNDLL